MTPDDEFVQKMLKMLNSEIQKSNLEYIEYVLSITSAIKDFFDIADACPDVKLDNEKFVIMLQTLFEQVPSVDNLKEDIKKNQIPFDEQQHINKEIDEHNEEIENEKKVKYLNTYSSNKIIYQTEEFIHFDLALGNMTSEQKLKFYELILERKKLELKERGIN